MALEWRKGLDFNTCGGIIMKKNDDLKCVKCGKWAKPNTIRLEGFKVRGWKCPKCGETYLHPGDANRVLAYNKLKNEVIKSKLSYSGNSLIVRIPKNIVNSLGLKKGEIIKLALEGPNKITVTIA